MISCSWHNIPPQPMPGRDVSVLVEKPNQPPATIALLIRCRRDSSHAPSMG